LRHTLTEAIVLAKTKGKQTLDLLDLPQKERIRLCEEIRYILRQKALEERSLQQRTEAQTRQPYKGKGIRAHNLGSYHAGMKPLTL
jgi:hypothetical protein